MAQIPNTQKKLREAKFFLSKMVEQEGSLRLDREDFEFYLSAFLSAARSVSFYLQSEQRGLYDGWFPNWEQALSEDDRQLLAFMNAQRRAEVHVRGADVRGDVEMVPVSRIRTDYQGHPAYGFHWFGPPGIPEPKMGQMIHYFEMDGTRERATETCKRYLGLLEKLIRDFEQAFP